MGLIMPRSAEQFLFEPEQPAGTLQHGSEGSWITDEFLKFMKIGEGSIKTADGKFHKVYRDDATAANPTIGYGHKLIPGDGYTEDSVLTEQEATDLLIQDIYKHASSAHKLAKEFYDKSGTDGSWDSLPMEHKQALTEIEFRANHGWGPKYREAIYTGDLETARREMNMSREKKNAQGDSDSTLLTLRNKWHVANLLSKDVVPTPPVWDESEEAIVAAAPDTTATEDALSASLNQMFPTAPPGANFERTPPPEVPTISSLARGMLEDDPDLAHPYYRAAQTMGDFLTPDAWSSDPATAEAGIASTRRRIGRIADEPPEGPPSALETATSPLINMAIPDPDDPTWMQIVNAAELPLTALGGPAYNVAKTGSRAILNRLTGALRGSTRPRPRPRPTPRSTARPTPRTTPAASRPTATARPRPVRTPRPTLKQVLIAERKKTRAQRLRALRWYNYQTARGRRFLVPDRPYAKQLEAAFKKDFPKTSLATKAGNVVGRVTKGKKGVEAAALEAERALARAARNKAARLRTKLKAAEKLRLEEAARRAERQAATPDPTPAPTAAAAPAPAPVGAGATPATPTPQVLLPVPPRSGAGASPTSSTPLVRPQPRRTTRTPTTVPTSTPASGPAPTPRSTTLVRPQPIRTTRSGGQTTDASQLTAQERRRGRRETERALLTPTEHEKNVQYIHTHSSAYSDDAARNIANDHSPENMAEVARKAKGLKKQLDAKELADKHPGSAIAKDLDDRRSGADVPSSSPQGATQQPRTAREVEEKYIEEFSAQTGTSTGGGLSPEEWEIFHAAKLARENPALFGPGIAAAEAERRRRRPVQSPEDFLFGPRMTR